MKITRNLHKHCMSKVGVLRVTTNYVLLPLSCSRVACNSCFTPQFHLRYTCNHCHWTQDAIFNFTGILHKVASCVWNVRVIFLHTSFQSRLEAPLKLVKDGRLSRCIHIPFAPSSVAQDTQLSEIDRRWQQHTASDKLCLR